MTSRRWSHSPIITSLLGLIVLFLAVYGSLFGDGSDGLSSPAKTAIIATEAGAAEGVVAQPANKQDKVAKVTSKVATLAEDALNAPAPTGKSLQPQLADANIDMAEVVTLLPPDAIRAFNPEEVPGILVTAAEADAAGIEPEVRIIGVSIKGDSQAYPIPFLSRHEIVNTELGGLQIAVTW